MPLPHLALLLSSWRAGKLEHKETFLLVVDFLLCRFISAMEKLAELSSDKEQLEQSVQLVGKSGASVRKFIIKKLSDDFLMK